MFSERMIKIDTTGSLMPPLAVFGMRSNRGTTPVHGVSRGAGAATPIPALAGAAAGVIGANWWTCRTGQTPWPETSARRSNVGTTRRRGSGGTTSPT